jgi:hypothetical protein
MSVSLDYVRVTFDLDSDLALSLLSRNPQLIGRSSLDPIKGFW